MVTICTMYRDIKNYLFCPNSVHASDYFLQHIELYFFVSNIACLLQGWNWMVEYCLEKLKALIVHSTKKFFFARFHVNISVLFRVKFCWGTRLCSWEDWIARVSKERSAFFFGGWGVQDFWILFPSKKKKTLRFLETSGNNDSLTQSNILDPQSMDFLCFFLCHLTIYITMCHVFEGRKQN